MAAQDMTGALKHPHPDVSFSTIGDDTITPSHHWQHKLTFKNKFQKPLAPTLSQQSPVKAAGKKTPINQSSTSANIPSQA
jgi:hypothetical protein